MKQFLFIQTETKAAPLFGREAEELVTSLKELSEPFARETIYSQAMDDPDAALDQLFQASGNLVL